MAIDAARWQWEWYRWHAGEGVPEVRMERMLLDTGHADLQREGLLRRHAGNDRPEDDDRTTVECAAGGGVS